MKSKFNLIFIFALLLTTIKAHTQEHKILYNYNANKPEEVASGSVTLKPPFTVPEGNVFRAYISNLQQSQTFMAVPNAAYNYKSIKGFNVPGIKTASQVTQNTFTTAEVAQSIEYMDGLGRPIQQVVPYGSVTGKDVIQPIAYDNAGRQPKSYQPYSASNGPPGNYRPEALTNINGYTGSEQYNFYQNGTVGNFKATNYPYAEKLVDPAGINQIEQGSIGSSWQLSTGHTTKADVAISSEQDGVLNWQLTSSGISASGNSVHVGLIKQIARDANWTYGKAGTNESFTDGLGRVLAQRQYFTENNAATTYYVYDAVDPNKLRYVLAPGFSASQIAVGDTTFNRYVYAYKYDERNRQVAKKIPGTGWIQTVYNILDQPVLSQDSMQRNGHEWNYTKYDVNGRIVLSGKYISNASANELQTQLNNSTINWETRDSNGAYGYTSAAFPVGNGSEVYGVNYYDDYDLPSSCPFLTLPTGSTAIVTGLPTASLTKVLNTEKYLWQVNYYDEDGQVIKALSQNNLDGTDELTSAYRFTGEIDNVVRVSTSATQTTTIAERYVYDDNGRVLQVWNKINNQPEIVLSAYVYNELGQLAQKKLHSIDGGLNFLQTIEYAYNEQGWLTNINTPNQPGTSNTKFGIELKYENAAIPQYNGNIGQSKWKVSRIATSPQMGYDFSYDKANRLTAAESLTAGNKDKNYSEYVKYDHLGNIRNLGRYALIDGVRTQIDSLSYQYEAGKHLKIDDTSGSAQGFADNVQEAEEYIYDGNGRVIRDKNKNINLLYNTVSLPKEITWGGTDRKTIYTYDVEGNKLKWQHYSAGNVTAKDYNMGLEYQSLNAQTPVLKFINTQEGRARFDGTKFVYQYNLVDHLGNVRATIDADPTDNTQLTARVIQENSYYPFGSTMSGPAINFVSGENNHYLYNGKELDAELGQYDYEARFYDPIIGRWSTTDPMAEKYYDLSPYNYVFNNPLTFTDPTGMDPVLDPNTYRGGEWYRVEQYGSWGAWTRVHYNDERMWQAMSDANTAQRTADRNGRHQQTLDAMSLTFGWSTTRPETPAEREARFKKELAIVNATIAREKGTAAIQGKGYGKSWWDSSASGYWQDVGASAKLGTRGDSGDFKNLPKTKGEVLLAYLNYALTVMVSSRSGMPGMPSSSKWAVKKGIQVTEASIAKALQGSTMKTLQGEVSLPMVQRYVKMLEAGSISPAIKVASGVIVEGNHRYVAGRLFGVEPAIVPGAMSPSQASRVVPIQQTKVNPVDWDKH